MPMFEVFLMNGTRSVCQDMRKEKLEKWILAHNCWKDAFTPAAKAFFMRAMVLFALELQDTNDAELILVDMLMPKIDPKDIN